MGRPSGGNQDSVDLANKDIGCPERTLLRELGLDKAWLPDGDSWILRLYVFGPSGLKDYGSATLRCKI